MVLLYVQRADIQKGRVFTYIQLRRNCYKYNIISYNTLRTAPLLYLLYGPYLEFLDELTPYISRTDIKSLRRP